MLRFGCDRSYFIVLSCAARVIIWLMGVMRSCDSAFVIID